MGKNMSNTAVTSPPRGLSVSGVTWHMTWPMAAANIFLAFTCNGLFCKPTYSCNVRSQKMKDMSRLPSSKALDNTVRWAFVNFGARHRRHFFFAPPAFAVDSTSFDFRLPSLAFGSPSFAVGSTLFSGVLGGVVCFFFWNFGTAFCFCCGNFVDSLIF